MRGKKPNDLGRIPVSFKSKPKAREQLPPASSSKDKAPAERSTAVLTRGDALVCTFPAGVSGEGSVDH